MRSAVALGAIVLSIALQTTLAQYIFRGSSTAIDLVLIVVVYIAIKSGPVTGLLAGTVAASSRTRSPAASWALAGWPRRSWGSCRGRWARSSS